MKKNLKLFQIVSFDWRIKCFVTVRCDPLDFCLDMSFEQTLSSLDIRKRRVFLSG